MSAANNNWFKEYERWLRVAALIDFAGKYLCRNVLHDQEQLPTDGSKLYQELVGLKSKICRFKDQYDTLCPPSGITDETKFDLTLNTSIIQQKFPNKYDSLVTDLRHARNHEFHRGNKFLSDIEFNDLWKKTTKMLEKHGFNIQLVGALQKCDLSSDQQFKDIAIRIFFQGMVENFFSSIWKFKRKLFCLTINQVVYL